jgi:flavin reductase (DIM6/NTAB) family NADH-FMN oxidoreductase RutF
MIVGSFTSVSLDPPLVGFFPDRRSTTWPDIRLAGRFCVNVLASDQHEVCRALSEKKSDKFNNVPFRWSGRGLPIITGAVIWIDCDLYAVHDAGDHNIVVGIVFALDTAHGEGPMIFHKGRYGRFLYEETSATRQR